MRTQHRRASRLVLCVAAAWQVAATAAAIEGRVYLDANRNGVFDAGEAGVTNVPVSDGARVAVTDPAGGYRLETSNAATIVWVCLPSGHAASGKFWRAVEDKGRADFGLVPQAQTEDFAFVQITDAHVGRADLVAAFAGHLGRLPHPFAFVVNTGDLVGGVDVVRPDKAQAQYDRYLGAAAAFTVPLFNLPGNHEHVAFNTPNPDTAHPFYGKGLYRRVFGPTYYSWDWAGVHFVALDGTTLPYQERLGDHQLSWLAADVGAQPADKPLVIFCHQSIPDLRDAKELAGILQGRRVLGAFCGHLHRTFTTRLGEIPVYLSGAMSGAWWSGPNIDGTPQGFRVANIKNGTLKTAFFSREGATPLSVVAPLASAVQSGTIEVAATVLDFGQPAGVSASFVGQPVLLKQASRDELWSVWRGTADTRLAFDGDRTLEITAKRGDSTNTFVIRYLVSNGRAERYQADEGATLKIQVRGIDTTDTVLFNGEPLGVIPSGTSNETTLAFAVSKERLAKFNRVTVRAEAQAKGKDVFSVGPVALEYKGKRIHDLRYASFERHTVAGDDPKRREKALYYCLP
ncbi:MAG TPA: metallophosphoesterase [Kiritimatiellia bacterium]|nr:metallophosphoesterase [Kiritimatiellia bacterium]HPS08696.1 metallophosphoesterase [Kiritimatiellia bacterium]